MTTFALFNGTYVEQTLAGNEVGLVANTAAINADNAIGITGNATSLQNLMVSVYGGVYSTSTHGISLNGGRQFVFIGDDGEVSGSRLSVPSFSAIAMGDAESTSQITNFGTLNGPSNGIYFGGVAAANLRVVNAGLINSSFYGVAFDGGGQFILVNSGQIFSDEYGVNVRNAGSLSMLLTNSGLIEGGLFSIQANGTSDQIRNTGELIGSVDLAGGADLFDGRGGRTLGQVVGGLGNDTLYGGLGADRLDGGADNDTLYFDAEDLRFGSVLGGTGYDTGVNMDERTPLTINMNQQGLEAYFGSAADEMVIGGNFGGYGLFANTGAGNDLIEGTIAADNFSGGMGVDVLYGRGGGDQLAGGNGGDWLQGGTGADTFVYTASTDSTVNGQDFIADFSTAEGDKISLTGAIASLGFVSPTFNTGYGTNASVYVFAQGGTSLVQLYTGATLQMQIVVSQASLAASDFVF